MRARSPASRRHRQRRLGVRRLDQIVAGLDLRRDAIEERRSRVCRQLAVRIERCGGRLDRAIDVGAGRFLELRQRAPGGERAVGGFSWLAGNQISSEELAAIRTPHLLLLGRSVHQPLRLDP